MSPKISHGVFSVGVVGALLGGLGIEAESASARPISSSASPAAELAGELATESNTLTRPSAITSVVDQGRGDLLGLGYEQRIALEGNTVKVFGTTDSGEKVLESFQALGHTNYHTHFSLFVPIEGFQNLQMAGLFRPLIAVGKDAIYVTEAINFNGGGVWYTKGTIIKKFQRIDGRWRQTASTSHEGGHVVSAISTGMVGGKEVVAVGLNKNGARVHNASDLSHATGYEFAMDWNGYRGWQPPAYARDQVSAIAVGDRGDGVEVVQLGRITTEASAVAQYPAERSTNSPYWTATPRGAWDPWYYPTSFTLAGGERTGAGAHIGVGYNGAVQLLGSKTGNEIAATSVGSHVRWVGFFADENNRQKMAVAADDGGRAFQYRPGTGSPIFPLVVGSGNRTVVTHREFLDWFPGYKTHSITVKNTSRVAVDVRAFTSELADRGCWLRTPMPEGRIEPGAALSPLITGYHTVGNPTDNADCQTAEKNFYLSITPVGAAGSGQLLTRVSAVNGALTLDPTWQISDGELNAALSGSGSQSTLTITDATKNTESIAEPTVTGQRLTATHGTTDGKPIPADPENPTDPMYPVYRFDVDNITWNIDGMAHKGSVTLPSTRVDAIDTQGNQVFLGYLQTPGTPTKTAQGLKLGAATFYIQNTKGENPYTHIRVTAGAKSTTVALNQYPAPPITAPAQRPSAVEVVPQAGPGATIAPFANGLDQSAVTVGLKTSNGQYIDSNDPRYGLIHYRNQRDNTLITGLLNPDQTSEYISITPIEGRYGNTGTLTTAANVITKHFLSTTTLGKRVIKATLGDTGTKTPMQSSELTINANATTPRLAGGGFTGITADGLKLENPADGPAPFKTGQVGTIGYQLNARAVTGTASLPLITAGPRKGHLTQTPIQFTNHNTAKIDPTKITGETFATHITVRGHLLNIETTKNE